MRLDPPFHFALSSLNSCQRLYLECFEHNDIQKKNVFFFVHSSRRFKSYFYN